MLQSVWRAGQKASTPDVIVESLLLKETRRTTVGAHVQLHSGPRLADVNVNSPGNPAVNNVFSLAICILQSRFGPGVQFRLNNVWSGQKHTRSCIHIDNHTHMHTQSSSLIQPHTGHKNMSTEYYFQHDSFRAK